MEFESKRSECPQCHSVRGFARYKGTAGGFCHACGCYVKPSSNVAYRTSYSPKTSIPEPETKYISKDYYDSLPKFENSTFAGYFGNLFGDGFLWHCQNLFSVKSDNDKSILFFYQNTSGNLVNAKKIKYVNGHRDKSQPPYFIKSKKDGFGQCLYNEYFLNFIPFNYDITFNWSSNPIILVESEKTVLIASYFFPQYHFIAVGGTSGLTKEKAISLKGRKILVCFDNEPTAQERANNTIKLLQQNDCQALQFDLFKNYEVPTGFDLADCIEHLYMKGKIKFETD
jgi:hypothetical protein